MKKRVDRAQARKQGQAPTTKLVALVQAQAVEAAVGVAQEATLAQAVAPAVEATAEVAVKVAKTRKRARKAR